MCSEACTDSILPYRGCTRTTAMRAVHMYTLIHQRKTSLHIPTHTARNILLRNIDHLLPRHHKLRQYHTRLFEHLGESDAGEREVGSRGDVKPKKKIPFFFLKLGAKGNDVPLELSPSTFTFFCFILSNHPEIGRKKPPFFSRKNKTILWGCRDADDVIISITLINVNHSALFVRRGTLFLLLLLLLLLLSLRLPLIPPI